MSYFNEDQLDHMKDLAEASKKGLTCPCGWFLKTDCERRCNSPHGSPEKHAAGEAAYRAKYPERFHKATTP
jgi:hypothetical protein